MEPKVIRDMYQCFLVMEINQEGIGYQQKMVLHNKIEGLLTVEQRQIDANCKLYYDITDKISLGEYFIKNKASANEVEILFMKLITIIQAAKEFLLEEDNFVLRRDCIYLSLDGMKLYLCFYQNYQVEVKSQFLKLAEYFMELIDYKEEQAVTLTYGIYKVLREDNCSFAKLKQVIQQDNLDNKTRNVKEDNKEHVPIFVPSQYTEENQLKHEKQKQYMQPVVLLIVNCIIAFAMIKSRWFFYNFSNQLNMKHIILGLGILLISNSGIVWVFKKLNNRCFEVDLSEGTYYKDGDTVVISNNITQFILRREDNRGEDIEVNTFPFILGANKEQAQGILQVPGVSKRHVMLEEKYNIYTAMDLGSTNGTFLNGEEMEPMKRYNLKEGDKITIIDRTYQFIKIS